MKRICLRIPGLSALAWVVASGSCQAQLLLAQAQQTPTRKPVVEYIVVVVMLVISVALVCRTSRR